MMLLKFIHVVTSISSTSCLFMEEYVPLHGIWFIYSPVDGNMGYFHFGVIMNNASINTHMYVFCADNMFIPFVYILGSGIVDHMIPLCLIFEELPDSFPKQLHHLISTSILKEGSSFPTSSPTLVIVGLSPLL